MTLLMHSHHDGPLFEPTTNLQERYDYIVANKPPEELPLRLSLFLAVPDEVVSLYMPKAKDRAAYDEALAAYVKARAACVKARAACDKARAACDKAGAAYVKAGAACDKARAAYVKAGAAYEKAEAAVTKSWTAVDKARTTYEKAEAACDYERMHRDLCWPWCPGTHIFAKGYDLAAIAGGKATP